MRGGLNGADQGGRAAETPGQAARGHAGGPHHLPSASGCGRRRPAAAWRGALLEESLPEESLPEEPLLKRVLLRRVLLERVLLTCWRDSRQGGRSQESPAAVEPIGGCRGAGVGVGRGGSLFRGAGRSRRTVPAVAARAPAPPSPLAAIPRLDGDPSRPQDRSNYLRYKGVPRRRSRRSVCCCRTLVCCRTLFCRRISALAHLLSHTRRRSAYPREGQPSPPDGPAPRHRASGAGLDVRGG
jgi:hypothetical protein